MFFKKNSIIKTVERGKMMKHTRIVAVLCCAVFLLPLIGAIQAGAKTPRLTFYFRGGKGIHVLLINLEDHELDNIHWTVQIFDHNVEKKNFSGTVDSLATKAWVKFTTSPFSMPAGAYGYRLILGPQNVSDWWYGANGPSWIIGNWILLRPFLAPIPPAN